jgi:hypothetical protein
LRSEYGGRMFWHFDSFLLPQPKELKSVDMGSSDRIGHRGDATRAI